MDSKSQEIYVVISQTGTLFSRVLKLVTHYPYNHVSISLDKDLKLMYSFARRKTYCPWIAGFIKEYPDRGVFKRKTNTKCQVYKWNVTEEQYGKLLLTLQPFLENPNQYHYNFLGLPLIWAGVEWKRQHHYVCSEFVTHLLVESDIIESCQIHRTIRPYEFSMLDGSELIYTGFLREYDGDISASNAKKTAV